MKISKSDTDLTPDGNNTFEKGNSKRLSKKENEKLHTSVERGIFLTKRAIPDIHQTVVVMSTRVKEPNDTGCNNLVKMIKYFNETKENNPTLIDDGLNFCQMVCGRNF